MSDKPRTWSRAAKVIGAHVLMGLAIGFVIALVNPTNWKFGLKWASTGALVGLAVGITNWFLRRST